jgi:DNA-3-methyladenine glycosylase
MFGPPGHAYVYLIYGMHNCFNVVARDAEIAGAVLVRALEPGPGVSGRTDGPGRLCRALGIDRRHNGIDLMSATSSLWLERRPGDPPPGPIEASPRIGVAYAGEWASRPWRFYVAASDWVSARPGRRTGGRDGPSVRGGQAGEPAARPPPDLACACYPQAARMSLGCLHARGCDPGHPLREQ